MPDIIRQSVLTDIAFETGERGLAGFKKLIAAYQAGQYATAAAEIKNSDLFKEVPEREQRNIMVMTLGEWPEGVFSGEDLTKLNEGLTLVAKPDAQGKWVIGRGHDIPEPPDPSNPPVWTEEQSDNQFCEDYVLAEQRARADVGAEFWDLTDLGGNATS